MSNLSSGKPSQHGPGNPVAIVILLIAAAAIAFSAAAMRNKDERKRLCESYSGVMWQHRCVDPAIFQVPE